jgi:endonuclease YncB( thermonuclease family)
MSYITFPKVNFLNRLFSCLNKNKNINTSNNILIYKNYMEDGTDIKWNDTTEFKFPIKGGRVIKVYDGDSLTIASKFSCSDPELYRFSIRLNGIDTPEIKGKDITAEEKEMAKNARDFVTNLVLNKFVRLENISNEKYGRVLADVYIGEIHLNNLLLKERYAVKYDGGTKQKPASWLKYRTTGEI